MSSRIANYVSAHTKPNQVDVVPVTTGDVDEPDEEDSEMFAYTGDTSHGTDVVGVSDSTPVYDETLQSKVARNVKGSNGESASSPVHP